MVFLSFLARFLSTRNMKCSKIWLPEILQRTAERCLRNHSELQGRCELNVLRFEGEIFQGHKGKGRCPTALV